MTLKTEVITDPLGRGYSGMSDREVANDLNVVYRTKQRKTLSGSEIFNVTDDVEYTALTDAQKVSWDALCAIDSINTGGGVAKAREAELFGAGTTTRANLIALKTEDISRATELGLSEVKEGHVQLARM